MPRTSISTSVAGLSEVGAHVGHADAELERGREGARGDGADLLPAGEHRVAFARDAGALDLERRQLLGSALAARAGDRLGTDEPGCLGAAPAEPGLDRVALGRQVVAVQVEADLEPQRVAGAEPAGDDAGVEQLGPDRRRDLGIDQQLDPVLAGVAGAADERRAGCRSARVATRIRAGRAMPRAPVRIARACGPCTASIA